MDKLSVEERWKECSECEFLNICFNQIAKPEEYEDKSCKTKDLLKEKFGFS